MTAAQLIFDALSDLGIYRPGQVVASDENTQCLRRLNNMIESWLLDRFLVFTIAIQTFILTALKNSYLIGPAAPDFNVARPTRIEQANIILNQTIPNLRLPLEIIDDDGWASIRLGYNATTSPLNAIPRKLYNDGAFPLSTLFLWPGPLLGYGLELFTWQQLTSFADLTTNYTFPPGYARMLEWNLAQELIPSTQLLFRLQSPLSDDARSEVRRQAQLSRAAVESHNAPTPVLQPDPAMMQGAANNRGLWNYQSDQWGKGR